MCSRVADFAILPQRLKLHFTSMKLNKGSCRDVRSEWICEPLDETPEAISGPER